MLSTLRFLSLSAFFERNLAGTIFFSLKSPLRSLNVTVKVLETNVPLKFVVVVFLYFYTNVIFSQAIIGDITYKVSFLINEEINKTPDLKNIFEEIREGLQMLEMKLYFINKESEFTVV